MIGPQLPPFVITDRPNEDGLYVISWLDYTFFERSFDNLDWLNMMCDAYLNYIYENELIGMASYPPPMMVNPRLFYYVGYSLNSKYGFSVGLQTERQMCRGSEISYVGNDGEVHSYRPLAWVDAPIEPNQYRYMNGLLIIEWKQPIAGK